MRTSLYLRVIAESHGFRLAFRQLPDGLWLVTSRAPGLGFGKQLWCGSLREVWAIAHGKQQKETA